MSAANLQADDRKLAWGIFALLFVSYAYFYQAGGWNENSRFDLVRALVEHRSLSIDPYHHNTGDKASFGGHYYSDKAPGLSFLAAPIYAVLTPLRLITGGEHDFVVLAHYLTTVLTIGVASAALGVLLFLTARRFGASPRASLVTALGYGLGTTAFPLSTLFFGHQMAALLLFSAFYLAYRYRRSASLVPALATALVLALAVLVEFPALPAALIIAIYFLAGAGNQRRLLVFLAGLAVPAAVLIGYLWMAFDSPFRIGYDLLAHDGARYEMQHRGFFGLTYPKPAVLWELLVGRYRGLLPYSPLLLLAVPGFFERSHRRERIACAAVAAYFLLFVSSYAWWEGGASFGSRHLAPMLPFVVLQLAPLADRLTKVTVAAVAISACFMLVVTAVQPKPAHRIDDPFWSAILPAFAEGRIAVHNICPELGHPGSRAHTPLVPAASHDAFNLGFVLGGQGHITLLPLVSLWLAGAWAFWNATRRKERERRAPGEDPDRDRNQADLPIEPDL